MSFMIGVLAIDGWTDVAEPLAMVDRCEEPHHIEGELDPRIAGFYERLRTRFPDHPPYGDDCPWMSMPLDIGIDHVFMSLSYGERSRQASEMIEDLAIEYGLTVWDPQEGSAYRPVREPSRADVARWWRELLDGGCDRDQTFDRVGYWVEEKPGLVGDPVTAAGLRLLHGYALGVGEPSGAELARWQAAARLP